MKKSIKFLFLLMTLVSCKSKLQKLDEAWKQRDKVYLMEYLQEMEDVEKFDLFVDMHVDLYTTVGFVYGAIDTDDINWNDEARLPQQEYIRKNVVLVYREYFNSKVFNSQNFDVDRLNSIQNDFFRYDRTISSKELKNIRVEFDSSIVIRVR